MWLVHDQWDNKRNIEWQLQQKFLLKQLMYILHLLFLPTSIFYLEVAVKVGALVDILDHEEGVHIQRGEFEGTVSTRYFVHIHYKIWTADVQYPFT